MLSALSVFRHSVVTIRIWLVLQSVHNVPVSHQHQSNCFFFLIRLVLWTHTHIKMIGWCLVIQSASPPSLYTGASNRTVVFNGVFDFYGNGTLATGGNRQILHFVHFDTFWQILTNSLTHCHVSFELTGYMCGWNSTEFTPVTLLSLSSLSCPAPALPPNIYSVTWLICFSFVWTPIDCFHFIFLGSNLYQRFQF